MCSKFVGYNYLMNQNTPKTKFIDVLSLVGSVCVFGVCAFTFWEHVNNVKVDEVKIVDAVGDEADTTLVGRQELQFNVTEVLIDSAEDYTPTKESMPTALLEFLESVSEGAEVVIVAWSNTSDIEVLSRVLLVADFIATQRNDLRTKIVINNQQPSQADRGIVKISALSLLRVSF